MLASGHAWACFVPSAGARAVWQRAASGSRALQTCRWLEHACSRMLPVTCIHACMEQCWIRGSFGVWGLGFRG